MVKDYLIIQIFSCNRSIGFVRCFNFGLEICKLALQRAYATFQKIFSAFTYLCGFNHRTIRVLNGNIGGYIDLCVICVLVVLRICYSLRRKSSSAAKANIGAKAIIMPSVRNIDITLLVNLVFIILSPFCLIILYILLINNYTLEIKMCK